jgi:O-antigen/teichoic acid export membrane protein
VGQQGADAVIHRALTAWREDNILRGVVKNSGYLFSSNTFSAALSFINTILTTRLLGVDGFGLVNGTIITFASNVNNLLSFRMYEAVVKFLGEALAHDDKDRAAAVAKGIAFAEAVTSIIAYLILLLLTPWAARVLGKDPSTAPLFAFYGLVLLANLVYETSRGILQTVRRFDRLAQINFVQTLIITGLITAAFFLNQGAFEVLAAYLVGKAFAGAVIAGLAFHELNKLLGNGWWRGSVRQVHNWREIGGFAINTNLNATVNLIVRDSAPNILAALRPADVAHAEVGYFRLAQSVVNLMMLPIEPFIWPTYSEITRTITARQWETTRRLLRRVSAIAAAWTLAAGGSLALLGGWLIPFLFEPKAAPAYPAMLILIIGYGVANVLNWNRPLLLALGKPAYPLIVAALVGAVELILTFWLVPRFGYLAEAAVLSGFFVISIAIIVRKGMAEIDHQQSVTASV